MSGRREIDDNGGERRRTRKMEQEEQEEKSSEPEQEEEEEEGGLDLSVRSEKVTRRQGTASALKGARFEGLVSDAWKTVKLASALPSAQQSEGRGDETWRVAGVASHQLDCLDVSHGLGADSSPRHAALALARGARDPALPSRGRRRGCSSSSKQQQQAAIAAE
eukprot:750203-Hanusia_phi.AAC.3